MKLTVSNRNGESIGMLVPLTIGHPSDNTLINRFVSWRNYSRSAWLDQREVTTEGTRRWLELLLQDDQRMAFLIFTPQNLLIGRLGFLDLTDQSAMIDSIVQGIPAVSPGIITRSFFAMTEWLFQNSAIETIFSKVHSDNTASIKLHHALGFHLRQSIPLASSKTANSGRVWAPVDETIDADMFNLTSLNLMCLTRSGFQSSTLISKQRKD